MPEVKPHIIHVANGRMVGETTSATVQELTRQAVDHGRLVVYFHGGLVSYGDGVGVATKLHPVFSDAGAFPIFFVWESGLKETLGNNLEEIAKERLFQLLWKRVAGIVLRKFGQDGQQRASSIVPLVDATRTNAAIDTATLAGDLSAVQGDNPEMPATLTEIDHIEQIKLEAELKLDIPLKTELAAVSAGLRDPNEIRRDEADRSVTTVIASTRTLMDPKAVERYVDRPTGDARGILSTAKIIKGVVMIAARTIKRFIQKRDHGFHATVVEEILRELYVANIGGEIWSMMKQDTEDCFKPDANVFGGTAFLEALGAGLQRRKQAGESTRITLVGHSTGAVYIANFLRHAQQTIPPDFQFDIIFLAPASTFELTGDMMRDQGGMIRNFRMFTMTDDNERNDRLVNVVYPHSLLYFVSGVVEKGDGDVPIVGMARYYDTRRYPVMPGNADLVREYMNSVPDRVCWSVASGGDGLRTAALKHGDFDDDADTLKSLAYMINQ